jgi:cellulose synthase/poly-beta-1,6-N-acetylglucosamine synthase-like glycosyltransferase
MDKRDDPVHVWLLRIYFTCLSIVWFYSLSRWKNLVTAVWLYYSANEDDGGKCDKNIKIIIEEDLLPPVTVQILSYNESEVIQVTIDKACALKYPTGRLFIQVLDDSTDTSAAVLVQNAVSRYAKQGVQISYKIREGRHGYKAGNLAHHFDDIQTEFVLYLDGDHQVQPDLLERTIPLFHNNPRLALVQTPWGYYNSHANLLTECDSICLDIHHTIEQTARSYLYHVFGFNGTGGVWRKQAIVDAGGWTWDTVTEDLAISYLAHLEGYSFQYISDCPQMLELPRNLLAHIQQKQRWTKGFMQVFRLYYGRVLFSKQSDFWTKLEAFMHFTGPIQIIAAITGILIFPYLVFHGIHTPLIETISIFPTIEPVCSALHAILTKATVGNANYSTTRIFILLPYFALRFGMAPFEFKAVCEGLFSNDATFHSTPKDGAKPAAGDTTQKAAIKGHWSDDFVAYCGLFVGLHQFLYIMAYDRRFERSTPFEFGIRLINVLVCTGMVTVSGSFLVLKHNLFLFRFDKRINHILSKRTLYPLIVAVCFLHGAWMCMFHVVSVAIGIKTEVFSPWFTQCLFNFSPEKIVLCGTHDN